MFDVSSAHFEVVSDEAFMAPVATDALQVLLSDYSAQRSAIERLHESLKGTQARSLGYFLAANSGDDHRRTVDVEALLNLPRAIKELDSEFWDRLLDMTDVRAFMPETRRNAWHTQMHAWRRDRHGDLPADQQLPSFDPETVRATVASLLNSRAEFFAERVDGVFRGLSPEHVTNAPEAFGKRMIVGGFGQVDGPGYYANSRKVGVLHDLRCVIAKFSGRDEPKEHVTRNLVDQHLQANLGQWVRIDGGAIRLRLYGRGTVHLEVHPDMAYRLNQVLASKYPLAIPAAFRSKPKKAPKQYGLLEKALPFAVLAMFRAGSRSAFKDEGRRFVFEWEDRKQGAVYDKAREVLRYLGGVESKNGFEFEYPIRPVLNDLVATGVMPDEQAFQYYPTQERMAQRAADWAGVHDDEASDLTFLEPSAGQGGLAEYLPTERTTCVEVSGLHCRVLEAKGFSTHQADFLAWAPTCTQRFDRIVMNPPWSRGRDLEHLQAAADLLAPNGVLVAILSGSRRGSKPLPGFEHEWSDAFENEFSGTSVRSVILRATQSTRPT